MEEQNPVRFHDPVSHGHAIILMKTCIMPPHVLPYLQLADNIVPGILGDWLLILSSTKVNVLLAELHGGFLLWIRAGF